MPTHWLVTSCCLQHRRRPLFSKDALLKPAHLKLSLPLARSWTSPSKHPRKVCPPSPLLNIHMRPEPASFPRMDTDTPPVHAQVTPSTEASFHNMNIWNVPFTTEPEKFPFYLWPNSPSPHSSPLSMAKEVWRASTTGGGASQQTGAPGSGSR